MTKTLASRRSAPALATGPRHACPEACPLRRGVDSAALAFVLRQPVPHRQPQPPPAVFEITEEVRRARARGKTLAQLMEAGFLSYNTVTEAEAHQQIDEWFDSPPERP